MYFCVVLYIVCFVSFSVLFVCIRMCTVLLPPGGYPIAVNRYIISYHIYQIWEWFVRLIRRRGMVAIIQCKIFCLPIWLSKNITIKIYRIVMLPFVLYGCETWSVTPREERRLRVFENRVLRRTFGPKRDEVIGECRRLHNVELHDLPSSNIIRVTQSKRVRWAGHVARMGERRGACRIFVREHLEDLDEDGSIILNWNFKKWDGGIDWIDLTQDRNR